MPPDLKRLTPNRAWERARAAPPLVGRNDLPDGVAVHRLQSHPDDRGVFTELFRREWELGVDPVQWNIVRSEAGVLRGVHVHPRHDDYLTIVSGRAAIGLRDLRPDSPTAERAVVVELSSAEPAAISIPHGVAHGFLFLERSIHCYAVSHYWDPSDELGCRWDDPELAIAWPHQPTLVSQRDAELGSLSELRPELVPA